MSRFADSATVSGPASGRLPSGPFSRLWVAYTVNVAGDEFYVPAVPLIAYQVGASAGTMSILFACSLLPQVPMGVLGGVVADRSNRVSVLRAWYLCSAPTLAAVCAAFTLTGVHLAGLAATAVLLGVAAPVSAAAFGSSIPTYVEASELSRANAMTEASRTVCVVLGPAAAGVLVGHVAPQYALLVNSFSFVVAFLLSWKAPTRGFMTVMGAATVAQGGSVIVVALSDSVVVVACAQASFVSGMLVYTVYWRAMRQAHVPSGYLGRVSGICRAIAFGGAFLGSLVSAALLSGTMAADTTLLSAGLVVCLLGIVVTARSVVRRTTTAM
ncbi:MFS transporter [Streptomyces sp. NPDC079020]|uniref:MFS transporter n=1 Tax=Streptomyces sp. NPDC079020 TaxID=3365722 RepID=UPI0037CCD07A